MFSGEHTNQAYTNTKLIAHTDLPYYTQPPPVYAFRCVTNELQGGESLYVDSFACAKKFKEESPDMFSILTSTIIPFRNCREGWNMACRFPIIEFVGGNLYRVRDSFFVRDNYQLLEELDIEAREEWYEAYSQWRKIIDEDPQFKIEFKLEAGDLVLIDNWRVYHGRNEYALDGNDGSKRLMELVYIDWNHVQNKLLKE